MGNVLRLVEVTNRDTVAILRVLLDRAIKGEVVAVAICYRTGDRVNRTVFSGIYKARPGAGVNAAMLMKDKLLRAQYESDSALGPS